MSIIYVMIPLALVLVAVAVWVLIWAIRSGQFDELESHGWTPVLDDDERPQAGSPDSDPGQYIEQNSSTGERQPDLQGDRAATENHPGGRDS